MESERITIELGDIIQINAPENTSINNNIYLVDYIDSQEIKLIDTDNFNKIKLNIIDGRLSDETIDTITLLSRSEKSGYARQNNLLPETWINLYFTKMDEPLILIGQIKELIEDMIEIKTYPDNKTIFIDFAYKGLPKELPLEKIIIRDKPVQLDSQLDTIQEESESLEKESIIEDEIIPDPKTPDMDLDDLTREIKKRDVKNELLDFIKNVDKIVIGEELGGVTEIVELSEKQQRFGIETQTSDLLDDILASIPTTQRTKIVINDIHNQINRFKQLRQIYSNFDEFNNITSSIIKGADYKPLVHRVNNLDIQLYWLLPVAINKKKLFYIEDLSEVFYDDITDVIPLTLADNRTNEEEIFNLYKTNAIPSEENKYDYLYNQLNPYLTPFESPEQTSQLLANKAVNVTLPVILDNNNDNYNSSVFYGTSVNKRRFLLTNYTTGLTRLKNNLDTKEPGKYNTNIISLTPSDIVNIKSYITLPEPVIRFSQINLPGTNILQKSSLAHNFLNYFQILNKKTYVNQVVVDKFESKIQDKFKSTDEEELDERFLQITEYLCDESLDDTDKNRKFLQTIIPRTRDLFNKFKPFLKSKFSLYEAVKVLEPFAVYYDDLTYKQYDEIAKYLYLKTMDYKKEFLQKAKAYSLLKLTNYRVKYRPEQLVNLQDNAELVTQIMKEYQIIPKDKSFYDFKLLPFTSSEIVYKMLSDDLMNTYASVITFTNQLLNIDDNFNQILESEKDLIQEKGRSQDNKSCRKYVISKRYNTITELNIDNDNTEVFFDKEYDETQYKILKKYKSQQSSMDEIEYKKFLLDEIINITGLDQESASREVDAILLGRKKVIDGDLAILINEDDIDMEKFIKVYYERQGNKWVKTELNDLLVTENNDLFCNINDTCFKINEKCLNKDLAVDDIKKNAINDMLDEFENKYNLSTQQYKELVKYKLEKSMRLLPLLKNIRFQDKLKYNKVLFNIGVGSVSEDIVSSPYLSLRDIIMGQTNFTKKQNDIILFVERYSYNSEEDPYWYYCNQTDTRLIPAFLYLLAKAFILQQSNNDFNIYNRTLNEICANQGEISDDGNTYVDKYSGYTIKKIEFDESEGYEASGYKMISRELIQEELSNVVQSDLQVDKEKKLTDPDSQVINNIIQTMTGYMGIDLSSYSNFIIRNTKLVLGKTVLDEETYNKKAKLHLERKGKSLPLYKDIKNSSIILISLSYILVSCHVIIPSLRTRKTFPGCIRSFSGYPLQGTTDLSSLTYISCIANKIKSSVDPWSSIKKLSIDGISKRIKEIIDKYILTVSEVQDKISEKISYLTLNESEYIPLENDINKWTTFLPPLFELDIKTQNPIDKNFEDDLLQLFKSGSRKQLDQINILYGKLQYNSLEIQSIIQKIINKKEPLLTNSISEPFLINSCCNESEINTIRYFTKEDPEIENLNITNSKLEYILNDIDSFKYSAQLNDTKDTSEKFLNIESNFSEETIYRGFITYCKFKSDIPIGDELLRICNSKPVDFNGKENINNQIDFLKKIGRQYTNESFDLLLKEVNKNNIFTIDTENLDISDIQNLRNILLILKERDNEVVSKEFVDKFLILLDTFDLTSNEDSEGMRSLKNYLQTSYATISSTVDTFISRNTTENRSNQSNINKFLQNFGNWSNIENTDYINSDDSTLYQYSEFVKTIVDEIINIFPNIILNKVNYDNVNIPKHWKLSYRHETDIRNFIKNQYKNIKQFYDEKVLISLLQDAVEDLQIYNELLLATPILSSNEDVKPLIDTELVYMLYKYYFINVIYQFILLTDSPKFVNLVQKPVVLSATDTTDLDFALDTLSTGEVSEVEISRGESLQLKKITCKFITQSLLIFNDKKSLINYNHDEIMERVLRSKEKEKDNITQFLKELTDEERELENLFKNNKLERWSKGLQKGLTQYVKETYDDERNEMERQILLEQEAGEKNIVTSMNLNIYSLELDESNREAQEIEKEAYDMTMIANDDDYGEGMDGDEAF